MDDISWKTQIPISLLASLLLGLELQGLVKAMPGKKFSLV
jgi:DNA processing protein